jgi:uncharacterized protein (DUF1501 family)
MQRRALIKACLTVAAASALPGSAGAFSRPPARRAGWQKCLLLIELKGGNDGLNTVVPYADPGYYALRPRIAIARDQVLPLSDRVGLHPALAPLLPSWKDGRLAILQGVGYRSPNLSHFRSIEIWDTASDSDEYRAEGWLARSFAAEPVPPNFAADGAVIGSNDLGPFAGGGTRALALSSTEQFVRRARLAHTETPGAQGNRALRHLLKVEADIVAAATKLDTPRSYATAFPESGLGNALRTACNVIANPNGVAALRVTLGGFDTHGNQPATQARLLGELGQGLAALRAALEEIDRWKETLILTYAEFGRRPKENLSNGTDHGTASTHFALGGAVDGGFHGAAPDLDRLDGAGNLAHTVDFRAVYATVLEQWWGLPSAAILGGRFAPLPFLRS